MAVKEQDPNEQLDNLICTLVKIHPLSLNFAFKRAAHISKAKLSLIRSRYYNKLRHERQLFCVKTDEVEIWNRKKMTNDELLVLESDQLKP